MQLDQVLTPRSRQHENAARVQNSCQAIDHVQPCSRRQVGPTGNQPDKIEFRTNGVLTGFAFEISGSTRMSGAERNCCTVNSLAVIRGGSTFVTIHRRTAESHKANRARIDIVKGPASSRQRIAHVFNASRPPLDTER